MSSHRTSVSSQTASIEEIDEDLKKFFKDFHIMTNEEITESEEKCKTMILESDESSAQQKWLVRKLVDLRYFKSSVMNDKIDEINHNGHCFKLIKQHPSRRTFCDFCSNCIWIFQQSYTCSHCGYAAHIKCVRHVERICSHVIVCEKGKKLQKLIKILLILFKVFLSIESVLKLDFQCKIIAVLNVIIYF